MIQKRKNGVLQTVAGRGDVDLILAPDSQNAIANQSVYNALRLKVERTVEDLINYYTKTETYTKAEVDTLIGTISTMTMKIVTALPETDISTTTIYLVKSGATSYDEYIYVEGVWAKIGSTEINLEEYYTKDETYSQTEVDELLDNLVTDVIIDAAALPTTDIQNIIYRVINSLGETEYYAGDATNQTTEQIAKRSDVTKTFIGTKAEWESLTSAQKAQYELVDITDDFPTSGKFVDITSQCTIVLGTAKVMKCGQIVVINGSVPKTSGSNGYKTIVTGVPVPISNGTDNSAFGNMVLTGGNSGSVFAVKVNNSTVTAYCSISYTQAYSIVYLTDE